MILHTTAPFEAVFPEGSLHDGAAKAVLRTAEFGYLEGWEDPEGFKIRRLISTDPAKYLDPKLSPGSYLK